MIQFLCRRTIHLAIFLVTLFLVTFILLHLAPGGPAQALLGPDQVSPGQQVMVEARLGLDQPLVVQLGKWISSAIRGDFGTSYFYRQPALTVVLDRLPNSLVLGVISASIAVVVGIPAGIGAARQPGGRLDRLARSSAVILFAMPSFWLGILLIFLFSVQLGWVPSSGTGRDPAATAWLPDPVHLILPATTMAIPASATFMLYTRSAMVEAMSTGAVRTARAMGVPESRILGVHAFRQAIAPVLMQFGLFLPHLVEGSIVVESVFSWPGIGQLTIASVGRRDYPVLLTLTIALGLATFLASTLMDVFHARFDPRIELR